jgi:hypothetical protein
MKSLTLVNGQPFVAIGALIMALVEDGSAAIEQGVFGDEGASVILAMIDALTEMGDKALEAEPEPVIGQYL